MSLPNVALSLRQPWAWLVVHGGKTLENRKWRTHRRGPFIVHASKGMTVAEYEGAVAFTCNVDPSIVVPAFDDLLRGGFMGRARIVDVLPPCAVAGRAPTLFPEVQECTHPWHMPEQFAFVLEDAAPLPFVPWKGELQFFHVPDAALARLEAK